jgi:undecaprenyl-diphosphatase
MVSRLGTVPVMAVPGLAVAIYLTWRRGWLPLSGWIAAVGGAILLDRIVKHFFVHAHAAATATSAAELGTPSGQALGALVGYGMLGYFLVLLVPSRRAAIAVVVAAFGLVLAICFGRLYLGARYFSDIVSGLAAGGVWLSACVTGLEVARRRGEREPRSRPGRRDEVAGESAG